VGSFEALAALFSLSRVGLTHTFRFLIFGGSEALRAAPRHLIDCTGLVTYLVTTFFAQANIALHKSLFIFLALLSATPSPP
jgi:hypothetical protein